MATNKIEISLRLILPLFSLLTLSACGGGGGDTASGISSSSSSSTSSFAETLTWDASQWDNSNWN